MIKFNIRATKAHFSERIKRAMIGEEVIIAKDNAPERYLGSAKSLIAIAHDFNAPITDFKEYQ